MIATASMGSGGAVAGVIFPLAIANLSQLNFVARAAKIPEGTIAAIKVPYLSRDIKVAGMMTFPDYKVTIMNDEDWSIRTMFESWQNSINSLESNLRTTNLDVENYKIDFNVRQFDKTGGIIRTYQMLGAFPIEVSAIQLDWEDREKVEVFDVTFAIDYWLPDPGDTTSQFFAGQEYYPAATTPTTID
jgi:hypothetical protein